MSRSIDREHTFGALAYGAQDVSSQKRLAHPFCAEVAKLTQLPQPLRLGQLLQLLQRVGLDLPDPLPRDAERPPDLLQRQRLVPSQAEPQLDHLALPIRQRVKRPLDVLPLQALR